MNNPKIIKIPVQSFCFGVKNAINLANNALNNPNTVRPIYMLGELVHNKYVSSYFEEKGIVVLKDKTRLEMLDDIFEGSVIFTAHGISDFVMKKAKDKKLNILDTTCPFVKKSITLIKDYLEKGYTVLYIGAHNHPETETALSYGDRVILVEDLEHAKNLHLNDEKLVLTNQTTMSIYDVENLEKYLLRKYPHLKVMEKVCNAAKERQEMLKKTAQTYEDDEQTAFVIIGDIKSHNTKKLVDIVKEFNHNVIHIETVNDLNIKELINYQTIIIASGTSTPQAIVDEVSDALENCAKYIDSHISSRLTVNDYLK